MSAPFPWLRKISSELMLHDEASLLGNAPIFDWSRFSSLAASHFGVQGFSIRPQEQQWREAGELTRGLGGKVQVMPVKISPLEGSAFWMMAREDISKLCSWMLHKTPKPKPLTSELLAEGFYRFLLLQTLDAIAQQPPFSRLSPILSDDSPMPDTHAFCIDVEIQFDERSCWGRLAIDPTLKKHWNQHFANESLDSIPASIAQSIELDLGLQVGSASLSMDEWKAAKLGDAILLDQGSYDPRKSEGHAFLTLGESPLFDVKVKHDKIQILAYASTYSNGRENQMKVDPNNGSEFALPLPQDEEELGTIRSAPMTVVVELARFRTTLDKLMKMAPGNLIELPIRPEQRANLTVNGQVIARVEIVHLGEALGIRVLEKG